MPSKILTSYVDGSWLVPGRRLITRENPGRLDRVASRWSPARPSDASKALEAAARAWPAWADTSPGFRLTLLETFLLNLESDRPRLATCITRENGKTLRESHAEIDAALADARYLLKQARSALRRSRPTRVTHHRERIHEPVGPFLLITPWNFPLATIVRKAVPALAFGNTVVLKPSELTPGTAAQVIRLLVDLPFPAGVVNLVLGTGPAVGPPLVGHPAMRGLSFTGSNRVGLELARQTAGRDVRLQLEMGGKNSLVVLADAALDRAVEAAVVGGFSCAGQWCTGTGRVIVEAPVYQTFCDRLATRAAALRVGPGDLERTEVGPVITHDRVRFARSTLTKALREGATIACGGAIPAFPPGLKGHFIPPTVLTGVTEDSKVFREELFLPILPVIRATDHTDALRLANAGSFGLSASIFTASSTRADHFLRHVEAGIAHHNCHTAFRRPDLPVSAWRESGRGIPECGDHAAGFFARPRAVYVQS